MKIFILEDNEDRMELFRKYFSSEDHSIYWTDEADHATDILHEVDDFDIIFLDHDLGDQSFVNSDRPDTGAEVARWLADSNYSRAVHIVVHSMNPAGQKVIFDILQRADFKFAKIIPFSQIARQMM